MTPKISISISVDGKYITVTNLTNNYNDPNGNAYTVLSQKLYIFDVFDSVTTTIDLTSSTYSTAWTTGSVVLSSQDLGYTISPANVIPLQDSIWFIKYEVGVQQTVITVTFSGNIITSNTVNYTTNGSSSGSHARTTAFNTSNALTLADIKTLLTGLAEVDTVTVGTNNLTILLHTGYTLTLTSLSITGGATQATIIQATTNPILLSNYQPTLISTYNTDQLLAKNTPNLLQDNDDIPDGDLINFYSLCKLYRDTAITLYNNLQYNKAQANLNRAQKLLLMQLPTFS